MALRWKMEIKKDDEDKVVEIKGTTKVGGQTVKTTVTADRISVTVDGTMHMKSGHHLVELAQVLANEQQDIKDQ